MQIIMQNKEEKLLGSNSGDFSFSIIHHIIIKQACEQAKAAKPEG